MEKTWIHYFGFYALKLCLVIAFIFGDSLMAENAEDIQTSIVDVETQIQNGNIADAKAVAQEMAFRKALDQLLPTTIDLKIRDEKIRSAKEFVKGFTVLDERREGGTLKLKYRCEVIGVKAFLNSLQSSTSTQVNKAYPFEITWKPAQARLNSTEFIAYVTDVLKAKVDSFKLGRGIFWITINSERTVGDIRSSISTFLGPQFAVNFIEAPALPANPEILPPPADFQLPNPNDLGVAPNVLIPTTPQNLQEGPKAP